MPKVRSDALRRARRRRRFVARRVALALLLALGLVSALAPTYGASPSRSGNVQPVSSVQAGTLPEPPDPPHPPPPDMGRVWAAAVAKDPSPDLATRGKTGTAAGRISLTFDDGPDRRTTPLILETLREHHIKATFFVVGREVEENPGLLRRIVADGHTIGNHSYDHADMSYLSSRQMASELQSTQHAVDGALGYHYPMALMRPPYGDPYFQDTDALPTFKSVIRQQRLFPVIWTIDTQDYLLAGNPQIIVRNVIRQDEAGRSQDRDEVILMHDIHPQDAQALPGIIDHYEDTDRRFVSVNELLTAKYLDP